jgi:hypothetical protein
MVEAYRNDGGSNDGARPLDHLVDSLDSRLASPTFNLGSTIEAVAALLDETRAVVASGEVRAPGPWLTVDDLAAVPPVSTEWAYFGGSVADDDPGSTLTVLVPNREGPLLCVFRGAANGRGLCRVVADLPHGPYPVDGREPDPWWCNYAFIFQVRTSEDGMTWRLFGECNGVRVGPQQVFSASAASDESLRTVRPEGKNDFHWSNQRCRRGAQARSVGLDGKLLAVWNAGMRGGLRMRLANPTEWDHAPDLVVFDDHVEGGRVVEESVLRDFCVYSHAGFALVLLSTSAGVHALRIAPDGAVRPWAVRREAALDNRAPTAP